MGDVIARLYDVSLEPRRYNSRYNSIACEISQAVSPHLMDNKSAGVEARRGVVGKTMLTLSDQTKSINQITHFITDGTKQINLLTQNASIEAAPAGEAGNGFPVVTAEVKNRGTQTTKAAENTGEQSVSMQKATEKIR